MGMRRPRGQSEQPSLDPWSPALLELAEIWKRGVRSHAASDRDDAHRNLAAPSTKSEELPEMETGKEVSVRSGNPSLQLVQDGKERLTPAANSLEVEGDMVMEKRMEESKQRRITARPYEIFERPGSSILHPLLIEESDSDSELPSWIPPSKAPEGSLLHALYLQLLGAGTDGITVRELFKCLKEPAEVLSFGSDWKVQVRRHLKNNPDFCESKGYHYLACNDQLDMQQPKNSPANIASPSLYNGASSSKNDLSGLHPATMQTGLSVDTQGVVRTRRKAFQKANAALAVQATTEMEEMHQSMDDMQIPSSIPDPTDGRPSTSSRKRKSPSSQDEKLPHHGHPISTGSQATEAETLAMMEVQTGQRCIAKEDDNEDWRCDKMAMAGDTICKECHMTVQGLMVFAGHGKHRQELTESARRWRNLASVLWTSRKDSSEEYQRAD